MNTKLYVLCTDNEIYQVEVPTSSTLDEARTAVISYCEQNGLSWLSFRVDN